MKKSTKIIIGVLCLIIVGLASYIAVDKLVLEKKNDTSKNEISKVEENKGTNNKNEEVKGGNVYSADGNTVNKEPTTEKKENNTNASSSTSTRENEILKAKEDIKNYIFNKGWASEIDAFKNEKKENITIDSDSTFYLIDSDREGMPTYVVNLNATVSKKDEAGEDYRMMYGYLLLVSHNGKNAFCEVIDGGKSGFSSIHASMDGRTIRTVVTQKGIQRTTYVSIYAKGDIVNRKTILDKEIDGDK